MVLGLRAWAWRGTSNGQGEGAGFRGLTGEPLPPPPPQPGRSGPGGPPAAVGPREYWLLPLSLLLSGAQANVVRASVL